MSDALLIPRMSAALDCLTDDDLNWQALRFTAYALELDEGDMPPAVDGVTYARRDTEALAIQLAKRKPLAPAARIVSGLQSKGDAQ